MTITEMMKNKMYTSSVSEIKRCSCVNIGFLNRKHEEDETQLNVTHSLLTDDGIRELSESGDFRAGWFFRSVLFQ